MPTMNGRERLELLPHTTKKMLAPWTRVNTINNHTQDPHSHNTITYKNQTKPTVKTSNTTDSKSEDRRVERESKDHGHA
jgi:hypothetical protein